VLDRQLTGDQGCFAGDAIVEQFEQIGAFGLANGSQREVVEDDEIGLGQS
jgi:hypothetical protein